VTELLFPAPPVVAAPVRGRSARILIGRHLLRRTQLRSACQGNGRGGHLGDLMYTGTPEGFDPVNTGDVLEGTIESVGAIRLTLGPAE